MAGGLDALCCGYVQDLKRLRVYAYSILGRNIQLSSSSAGIYYYVCSLQHKYSADGALPRDYYVLDSVVMNFDVN